MNAESTSPAPTSLAHVRDSFARAAGTYAGHAAVQVAMADWLAEWLPTNRSGQALELGAGTGVFTRRLLPWTGTLTATDMAEAMCNEGRVALPQMAWRVMRAEAPERQPACDWIFSSSMLQWMEDPGAVYGAWREALKPGGRVLAGLFVEGSLPELRALTPGASPLTWRTPAVWDEALERGGLRRVRSEASTRVFYQESALELLRSLHGVGAAPVTQFAPGRLRRVLREYETRHRDERGVPATWVFYRFEAERMA
jgi:malonyl-CoA O-methyltransferase